MGKRSIDYDRGTDKLHLVRGISRMLYRTYLTSEIIHSDNTTSRHLPRESVTDDDANLNRIASVSDLRHKGEKKKRNSKFEIIMSFAQIYQS